MLHIRIASRLFFVQSWAPSGSRLKNAVPLPDPAKSWSSGPHHEIPTSQAVAITLFLILRHQPKIYPVGGHISAMGVTGQVVAEQPRMRPTAGRSENHSSTALRRVLKLPALLYASE